MDKDKEIITPFKYMRVGKRLDELLIHCWRSASPMFPKMLLEFQVFPEEKYFSTVGHIFWMTPYWRGDDFTKSVLYHEGLHWSVYPVDLFRAIGEVFEARRILAEEKDFKPKVNIKGLYHREEDWSKFPYTVQEFQFVQNILGDYLVNLTIYERHNIVWNALWKFLFKEGKFHDKDKTKPRDSTFVLYIAVYPHLISKIKDIDLRDAKSLAKVEKIARMVREVREGRCSTVFALKEMVKLFHDNIVQDYKEGAEGQGADAKRKKGKSIDTKCPICANDTWEIIAVQKADGTWENTK